MSQLNLVNFSEVFKDAQETGIKSLLDCSPDVNFQFYDEEGVLESSIKCHKLLLSLVSPVFKKQFFGSLASTTEKLELVEIKDFSFEGFTQMMKLIYDTADNMFEKLFYNILDVALLFEILRLADKYQIEDLAALAKTRIATVPLSDENALEVLEVTEQHKDLLNFEEICKAINLRLAITMKSTWTSSADVDSFCNLYKDRVDLVNILISNVYRVTLDGRVTYPRIKIPEVTTSYMLKYIDYQKFLEQSEEEEEESFHDVEFQITDKKSGEESIRAHKILLGLVSPVFKKMFFGFLSRRTDGVEVVKVKEESANVFKTMVKFIYKNESDLSEIDHEFDFKNVDALFELFQTSTKYQLTGLCALVKSKILDFPVSTKNAVEVFEVLKKYGDESNLSTICAELKERLITTLVTWESPVEVLLFWTENKDNEDSVKEIFDCCFLRYSQEQSQLCEMYKKFYN